MKDCKRAIDVKLQLKQAVAVSLQSKQPIKVTLSKGISGGGGTPVLPGFSDLIIAYKIGRL